MMSDSEENKSSASSALLNIASAYSDSESSEAEEEDEVMPQKSLGSLVENLRAEAKKAEMQIRTVQQSMSQCGPEKSHAVSKIVRLDSGKIVKISASAGSRADLRTEESNFRTFDDANAADGPFGSQGLRTMDATHVPEHNSVSGKKSGGNLIEAVGHSIVFAAGNDMYVGGRSRLEDAGGVMETGSKLESEPVIESRAGTDSTAGPPDPMTVRTANSENPVLTGNGLLRDNVIGDECSTVGGTAEVTTEVDMEEDADVSIVMDGTFRENDSGDISTHSNVSNSVTASQCNDRNNVDKTISHCGFIDDEPSSGLALRLTEVKETLVGEEKTEPTVINVNLQSDEDVVLIGDDTVEINEESDSKAVTDRHKNENSVRFHDVGALEGKNSQPALVHLSAAGSDAGRIVKNTQLRPADLFRGEPAYPEVPKKPISKVEKVRPEVPGVAVGVTVRSERESLITSSSSGPKASGLGIQAAVAPEVRRTGPVKLKRNFSCISNANVEVSEKKFRPEPSESARLSPSGDEIPPKMEAPEKTAVTSISETAEIVTQQLESLKSPPRTSRALSPPQAPTTPSFLPASSQPTFQASFTNLINPSQNQVPSMQLFKKAPQPVPRVTRREEHRRTLPLILRKADISGSRGRDASKAESSAVKLSPKTEDPYSKVTDELKMNIESSVAPDPPASPPFSNSLSSQESLISRSGLKIENNVDPSKDSSESKLPENSGSDNAQPAPVKSEDEESKNQFNTFLGQSNPPQVDTPVVVVPKKRGRPRKFPLPETPVVVPTVQTPAKEQKPVITKSSKRTPKATRKVKADENTATPEVATPRRRFPTRFRKKVKKPPEGEQKKQKDQNETPRNFNKKGRMEVVTEGCKPVTVNQIIEYFWPPVSSLPPGEKPDALMIQEQICEYLGVKSFKRKYPSIKRRPVDMEERNYLQENGYVSENMCDMGLTAVYSADIIEIMYNDFPHKFEEYRRYSREKKQKEQKALREKQAAENMDPRKEALESIVSWNTDFNKTRRHSALQRVISNSKRRDSRSSVERSGVPPVECHAPDVVGHPPTDTRSTNKGVVLSVTVESNDIDHRQDFEDNLLIVGSPYLLPCARNSFYVEAEDKRKEGQPLCYGDVFTLRCAGETEVPLYVSVPIASPFTIVGASGYPSPRLCLYRGFDSRFKILHLNEGMRGITNGLPVAPFERILIVHAPANAPLCVESSFWQSSLFSPECEISTRSTLNYKKEYDSVNKWMLVVGRVA